MCLGGRDRYPSLAMALDLTGNWKATLDTEEMAGPDFYIRQTSVS
jgi:hypothetical protein